MVGTSGNSLITTPENRHVKPESFSATSGQSWMVWIQKFKSIAALNNWISELQTQILPAYLKGLEEQTYYSLTAEQTATWMAVERALTHRFHRKESHQVHTSTLRAKLRCPDEDLHQLWGSISCLVGLAFPNDPRSLITRTARDFFIGALTPITLREVLDLGPNTLDDALTAAQWYESNQKVLKKGNTRVLSSKAVDQDKYGSQQGTQEPPAWAWGPFQQQAEN